VGDLQLNWRCPLSEFRSEQVRMSLISHFTMDLNGNPYDCVIT